MTRAFDASTTIGAKFATSAKKTANGLASTVRSTRRMSRHSIKCTVKFLTISLPGSTTFRCHARRRTATCRRPRLSCGRSGP